MAIMNRSGYLTQISQELSEDIGRGPDFPETNINSAPEQEVLKDPVSDLENKEFVKDPALQQTAISTDTYPNTYSQIQSYMQGHSITCVYFSSMNVNVGARSNIVDSAYLKNVIHSQWIRIDQYEINSTEGFQYNTDTEKASTSITLVAKCYPGVIDPKVGDVFIASAGDQRELLFVVSSVSPLSWRNNTVYQIGAYVLKTLDQSQYDVLNRSVMQRYTFSKANYAEGKQALLTSDAAVAQTDLQKMRNVLSSRYFQMFYNRAYDTLMRPDGYYDPYVVRFVNDQSDITVAKYRARQLFYPVEQSYYRTIYSRLETNDSNDLDGLYSKIVAEYRMNVITDAYITPLTGRGYLTMDYWDGDPIDGGVPYDSRFPYIFSQGFYDGNITEMSEFERFLYNAVTTGKIPNYQVLYNVYVKTWQSLSPMEQFYRIPIYIWMIDTCLNTITTKTT